MMKEERIGKKKSSGTLVSKTKQKQKNTHTSKKHSEVITRKHKNNEKRQVILNKTFI